MLFSHKSFILLKFRAFMAYKNDLKKKRSNKIRKNISSKLLSGSGNPDENSLAFLTNLLDYKISPDSELFRGFSDTLIGTYSQPDNLQYQMGHFIAEAMFSGAEMAFKEINSSIYMDRPSANPESYRH